MFSIFFYRNNLHVSRDIFVVSGIHFPIKINSTPFAKKKALFRSLSVLHPSMHTDTHMSLKIKEILAHIGTFLQLIVYLFSLKRCTPLIKIALCRPLPNAVWQRIKWIVPDKVWKRHRSPYSNFVQARMHHTPAYMLHKWSLFTQPYMSGKKKS
jgi:hypothetical protein